MNKNDLIKRSWEIHSKVEESYLEHPAKRGDSDWLEKQRLLLADMAMHLLQTSLNDGDIALDKLRDNLHAILSISNDFFDKQDLTPVPELLYSNANLFNELTRFKQKKFNYDGKIELNNVCNASKKESGVYLVYSHSGKNKELIYIGSSGSISNENSPVNRKNDALFGRIVNGKQFGESRKVSWLKKMKEECIDHLEVLSYTTFNGVEYKEIPSVVEGKVIQEYFNIFGKLPRWNKRF